LGKTLAARESLGQKPTWKEAEKIMIASLSWPMSYDEMRFDFIEPAGEG
jgi:hypothetical protein